MTYQRELTRHQLGRTGIAVTPIGLGGAWLGYQPEKKRHDWEIGAATVLRALELGIRLIDTSPGYGESEQIIGVALSEWFHRGGRRADLILSSKTGTRSRPKDYTATGTRHSVEHSLKSLGVDYLDVMLVHDPETIDPVLASGGALSELQHMKSEGLVHAIGLGVRSHDLHRTCIESGHFEVSLTYGDFNLLNQSAGHDLLPLAAQYHVGIFNAMVVEYGLLGGQDPRLVAAKWNGRMDPQKVQKAVALWDWAQANKVNMLSAAIQFSTRDERVDATLVGAASPDEIEEDMAAYQQTIAEPLWMELHQRFNV